MRRPLNAVWKIPRHLTSHTRAYAYFSNIRFNLYTIQERLRLTLIPLSLWRQVLFAHVYPFEYAVSSSTKDAFLTVVLTEIAPRG